MREPRYSCPLTDKTKKHIQNIILDLKQLKEEMEITDISYIDTVERSIGELDVYVDLMEEMRDQNTDLRERGNYWKEQYEKIDI